MSSQGGPYYDDGDDDYRPRHRSPSRRSRDYSPDYHSGGSRMTGAIPGPTIVPVAPYDGPTPFYPPPPRNPNNSLQVPYSPTRPRSQPPFSRDRDRDRSRDRSRDRRDRSRDRRDRRDRDKDKDKDRDTDDSEADHDRLRSPLGKAKHIMQHTFSDSTSGLGVGVMGAIIGGLAAREATEAATRKAKGGHSHSRRASDASQGAALLSTIVGAAVGGLGANALEKRIEKSRSKTKEEQGKWEKKFGKDGKDDGRRERDGGRDRSRDRDRERRERERAIDMEEGRAGGRVERRRGDYYDDDSEPDYVYDQRPRRRRSEE
ncbi:hypothetical protein BR93DRAFT_968325 [Coniochaeta sp. PMI_546]|nr:hypothetical protein BR93DRAFT_968325 [Coniochaeta sp. PMI_546]